MRYNFRKLLGNIITTVILFKLCTTALASEWVIIDLHKSGNSTTELSTEFTKQSGKFTALPESFLDETKSLEGEFLVGRYRDLYDEPIEYDEKWVDEIISTLIIDCEQHYVGTLKTIKKRHGEIVSEDNKNKKDVLMIQMHMPNKASQLCELYKGNTPTPMASLSITNPSYNPSITAEDINALFDKYTPPGYVSEDKKQ